MVTGASKGNNNKRAIIGSQDSQESQLLSFIHDQDENPECKTDHSAETRNWPERPYSKNTKIGLKSWKLQLFLYLTQSCSVN